MKRDRTGNRAIRVIISIGLVAISILPVVLITIFTSGYGFFKTDNKEAFLSALLIDLVVYLGVFLVEWSIASIISYVIKGKGFFESLEEFFREEFPSY